MPRVTSSMIGAIEYSEADAELYVTFHTTGTYTYYGVPKRVYDAFLKAGSKGTFFNEHIRDEHPYDHGAPRRHPRRGRKSRR
jgi:hypothetical protein